MSRWDFLKCDSAGSKYAFLLKG